MNFYSKLVLALLIFISLLTCLESGQAFGNEEAIHIDTKDWIFPTSGKISDEFGTRGGEHRGIDISGSYGESVRTVEEGEVTKSYYSSSYGHVIFVSHPSGYETVYAHLSNRLVKEGAKVQKGQVIGQMGSTGRSSGTHLHFEIHVGTWEYNNDTTSIDPYIVFGKGEVGHEVLANLHTPYLSDSVHTHIEQQTQSEVHHIVKDGDTLWDIAIQYEIEVKDIMDVNELSDSLIVVGQELTIPKPLTSAHLKSIGFIEVLSTLGIEVNGV
ncbi:peptidoglycan DD-metalloendopeptidase family protein [Bacillus coahuilensis]|uniref:peptidoglycan DD-metalloendopeptidase family protein n=1 Tax=Bacillus coahuilensis TaxID=408580 RepID=UPI0001850E23|nr:peptidoglycan DD-metalloendopeptidase family protein [Bacillus coahuilensis]